jgi:hypothetical protein
LALNQSLRSASGRNGKVRCFKAAIGTKIRRVVDVGVTVVRLDALVVSPRAICSCRLACQKTRHDNRRAAYHALAHRRQLVLDSGVIRSYSALAVKGHASRAGITQIIGSGPAAFARASHSPASARATRDPIRQTFVQDRLSSNARTFRINHRHARRATVSAGRARRRSGRGDHHSHACGRGHDLPRTQ